MRRQISRPKLDAETKRELILDAGQRVFARDGLDQASLRGIAAEAGYTPAALYFHFESKEVIYASLLARSLEQLNAAVDLSLRGVTCPKARFRAAALAWFDYYAGHRGDLELGFYLFRSHGLSPRGLGRANDQALNNLLARSLEPLLGAAMSLGASPAAARNITAATFAHATGLLVLANTGRMRLFSADPRELMTSHVDSALASFGGAE